MIKEEFQHIYKYLLTLIFNKIIIIVEQGRVVTTLKYNQTLNPSQCSVLFVLVVYMKVVSESNIVSDRIKAFLDDRQWPEDIKDSWWKQIKMQT